MQQSEFHNTSKWIPPLGVEVFQIFETKMQITNLVQIGLSLDYWKGLEAQIQKMSSHLSFKDLKVKVYGQYNE
jgi:hypothetical protein